MKRIAIGLAVLLCAGLSTTPGISRLVSEAHVSASEQETKPDPKTTPSPEIRVPDKTRLLIATRQVRGPFFARSVILLMEHKPSGSLGLILNLPTPALLTDALPKLELLSKRKDRLHLGGPVEPRLMMFLIRSDQEPPDATRLLEDVYATASADTLLQTIKLNSPASQFHAYVGYSGWGPGQLDTEIERGDWYMAPANARTIFDSSPSDLWQRLVAEHEGIQVRNQNLGNFPEPAS